MSKHEWRERTPEGEVRYVTARRHMGKWLFQTCLKSDDQWTSLDALPLEDLKQLRDVLWRKYQRKRVPYEHVLEIDAMIEEVAETGEEVAGEAGESKDEPDLLEAGESSEES